MPRGGLNAKQHNISGLRVREHRVADERVCVEEAADGCQQNSDEQSLVPSPDPCHVRKDSGKRRPVQAPRRKVGVRDSVAHGSRSLRPVRSWIDRAGEVVWEPSASLIAELVEAGQPFWLDIENPTDEVIDQLATRLGLHPLAVEDSKQFGQRAKLQIYENGAMLVGFGLDEQLREPVEVHCYYTTGFLITLRGAASPAIDALRVQGCVAQQAPPLTPCARQVRSVSSLQATRSGRFIH
jgi:Mg2+ and Co2+ transporter CorA